MPQYKPELIASIDDLPSGSGCSLTSTSGSKSVSSCSARADMASPGMIAPPDERSRVGNQINGDRGADVDGQRRPIVFAQPIDGDGVYQAIDPDFLGHRHVDHQRQIGVREDLNALDAAQLRARRQVAPVAVD